MIVLRPLQDGVIQFCEISLSDILQKREAGFVHLADARGSGTLLNNDGEPGMKSKNYFPRPHPVF